MIILLHLLSGQVVLGKSQQAVDDVVFLTEPAEALPLMDNQGNLKGLRLMPYASAFGTIKRKHISIPRSAILHIDEESDIPSVILKSYLGFTSGIQF